MASISPNEKSKSNSTKTKERVFLTEEEKNVLQSLLQEWVSKPDKKSRDAYLASEVLPKIQQLNPDKYGAEVVSRSKEHKVLWERRAQAVHTWLKNHKPFKDKAVFKLERKLSLRQVVSKLRTDDIHQLLLDKNPDVQKGDKEYPGLFQQALTMCMKRLTDDEVAQLEQTRTEWQDSGPPMDVRLRAAKKYCQKGISNAHNLLHKQMFVSCISFSFFPDPDTGVMGIVCHDYIANIHLKSHGKKFKTFREWNSKGYDRLINDLIGYADYVATERQDNSEPEVKASPVTLNSGAGLLPLLPPAVNGIRGTEIAKQAQEIIRAYFLRHYKMATGSDNAHTPWAQIGMDPSNYFDVACMPEGFKIQDPSRMGLTVKDLLNHLRKRQEELGVNAFRFHHVLKNQKLEVAEYPPEATAVFEGKSGEGSEDTTQPANGDQGKEGRKKKTKAPAESAPDTVETVQQADSDFSLSAESNITQAVIQDHQLSSAEPLSEGSTKDTTGSTSPDKTDQTSTDKTDLMATDKIDKPAIIVHPQVESHKMENSDSVLQSLPVPASFNFPPDPIYHAYQHQQMQAPMYQHTMPGLTTAPQTWPSQQQSLMQGPNFAGQANPYLGPPYQMAPMMNLYHPHYRQSFPASNLNGQQNMHTHGYPPIPIDPHLQLPPGEPTFVFPQNSGVPEMPPPAFVPTADPAKVTIMSPMHTPSKSSPTKKSPLKRKRVDSAASSPTHTPSRRSGRAVRTPKKMQDAGNT